MLIGHLNQIAHSFFNEGHVPNSVPLMYKNYTTAQLDDVIHLSTISGYMFDHSYL